MLNGFMLKFAHGIAGGGEGGGIFSNLEMSKSRVTNLFARSECDKMLCAANGLDAERVGYRQGCNNT